MDLSEGVDAALSRFSSNTRTNLRRAERGGVHSARSDSPEAGVAYYAILCEAARAWGLARPPVELELIQSLLALGQPDVEVWVTEWQEHAIGGAVVLYGSQEAFGFTAATRREFFKLRPSEALNAGVIAAASRRNLRWCNIGSSAGLPGVENFKKHLGAVGIPYAQLRHQGLAFGLYTQLRESMRRIGAFREGTAASYGSHVSR